MRVIARLNDVNAIEIARSKKITCFNEGLRLFQASFERLETIYYFVSGQMRISGYSIRSYNC